MKTWVDLEERFRALAKPLQFVRLDMQWGAAGEHWRIAGTGALGPIQRQFETLCGVGGRWLEKVLPADSEIRTELLAEQDPIMRWYRLLKQQGQGVEQGPFAWQTDEAGNHAGNLYTATIHNLVDVCANQCLELEVQFPVREEKKPWYGRIYEDYGKEIIRGAFATLIAAMITAALAWIFRGSVP